MKGNDKCSYLVKTVTELNYFALKNSQNMNLGIYFDNLINWGTIKYIEGQIYA